MEQIYDTSMHKKIFGIPTSSVEIRDIIKAWFAISLAFTILMNHEIIFGDNHEGLISKLLLSMLFSGITVGIGFIFHEMAHKIIAQRYNCWAEFRSFDKMLLLAIAFSFFGFIFAAPGAVMISGRLSREKNGIVSAAGPLMNFAVAFVFLFLMLAVPVPLITQISAYGFMINSWLGLFNLIPIWNLDGAKVLQWNKIVYGFMVAVGISLLIIQQISLYIY